MAYGLISILKIAKRSFSYWIDNVDLKKHQEFRKTHKKEMIEKMREIRKVGGQPGFLTSNLKKPGVNTARLIK